ncbi:MAG: aminotransferase class V-fold PLP-dependent enzyme [Candidatus Saccharibacteria bacterium]
MFGKKVKTIVETNNRLPEFSFIRENDVYMDSACQSMRPKPVIDSLENYYKNFNACGGRVKYKWGQQVDSQVQETRDDVIDYLGLNKKNYICSFTLNTTYGLNLILSQLPVGAYKKVVTSPIEHNSVFLPTIELAKRLGIDRVLLSRSDDGSLDYEVDDFKKAVVVLNATSNIDGRVLNNLKQLVSDVHNNGGIIIVDAAQTMAHNHEILIGCDADAICFSAHKMYGASLGGMIVRKELLQKLDMKFIGGGMVSSVRKQQYTLLSDDIASWLEPGLQAYGEIICLNQAIKWLKTVKPYGQKPVDYLRQLSGQLFDGLNNIPNVILINSAPSNVISVYSKKVDAHRLAIFLSASGIMVRSGYFCCHYYLLEEQKLPPLLRFSIGLHTTKQDIDKAITTMTKITKG